MRPVLTHVGSTFGAPSSLWSKDEVISQTVFLEHLFEEDFPDSVGGGIGEARFTVEECKRENSARAKLKRGAFNADRLIVSSEGQSANLLKACEYCMYVSALFPPPVERDNFNILFFSATAYPRRWSAIWRRLFL